MSKESIFGIVDATLLKGLNPDYQSEGQEPAFCVWIECASAIPPEVVDSAVVSTAIKESLRRYSEDSQYEERVLRTLMRPWREEPIRSGVATKTIPFVFSQSLCQKIEKAWDEMPMDVRDMLNEKSGDLNNPHLSAMLERIKAKEVQQA